MKSKWLYQISYRLVALIHFGLVAFLAYGTVAQFYVEAVKKAYLPLLLITLLPSITKKYCPLSALEGFLRKKYDLNSTYTHFWDYYLQRKIRLPQTVVVVFFILLLVVALRGRGY